MLAYLIWIGPERFYYESFGTWIVSPLIYVRILPVPLNHWLLRALNGFPPLHYLLYAAPIIIFLLAMVAAFRSIRRRSLNSAFCSLALITLIFGVYHLLQPLGISFIREGDAPGSAAVN